MVRSSIVATDSCERDVDSSSSAFGRPDLDFSHNKGVNMADPAPQNFANHVRFDPPFHYFVLPVFAISWIVSVVVLVRRPCFLHFWAVIFVTAIIIAVIRSRQYALKVQDRVIRLEERLRLATLLPDSLRSQIAKLSERQLIALRFASDGEVLSLVERTLATNLAPADIKKAIKNWRPDCWRV
jgi:hypothetical protein